jgi:hypothetical protein
MYPKVEQFLRIDGENYVGHFLQLSGLSGRVIWPEITDGILPF